MTNPDFAKIDNTTAHLRNGAVVISMDISNAEEVPDDSEEAYARCNKGIGSCFCKVGFPYEYMCPKCRDEPNRWFFSRCVCDPDDD